MTRPLHLLLRALLVSGLPTLAWAAYEAPPEAAALRIGVAPFQVVSPPDVEVPDLADSLAEHVTDQTAALQQAPTECPTGDS